jgi:hypothetical protein
VASRRDSGKLRKEIIAFRHDLGRLGEGIIIAFGRDLGGLGGGIKGFGHVHAIARFLKRTLRSNCYKAFCFALLLALEVQQRAQLANSLLVKPFFAKEENGRFW